MAQEISAKLTNFAESPQKTRLVIDLVRGKNQALDELEKMAKPVTAEKQEQPDHSEEEDYYYGLGM